MDWDQFDLNPKVVAALKRGNATWGREMVYPDVTALRSVPSDNELPSSREPAVHKLHERAVESRKALCPTVTQRSVFMKPLSVSADIKSIKEVLNLSGADLQRLMKLSGADVECLLKTVSRALRKSCVLTALQLYQDKDCFSSQRQKLSLGCSVLDDLLKGGIPLVGITELAGESSAGKTQIGLQLCLCVQYPYRYGGLESGKYRPDTFHNCITKRISVLLARGAVRLVVIDSIAALFRCEFGASDSVLKARYLQTFGAQLHGLSSRFRAPIMCINQVTDAMSNAEAAQCGCRNLYCFLYSSAAGRVCPALGITWANQLLMRLMVSRVPQPAPSPGAVSHHPASVRTLRVVFAPHLPPSFCCYTVKLEGVKGMK
ncbi:hypothetical protein ASZ78_007475 [Callipepla squamata]|uniref:RecA family profile 1 domain-containing protein n=1 Tax=Callipepla squamata TaxID=9009 RepID=A0A226MMN8_CALSU|nr:hypothetical protein ASZ78_007475 [Callipepla squamata]